MAYSIKVRGEAIELRKKGYSINEISEILKIAKSTSSSWISTVNLNKKAQVRLKKRNILGQYKSVEIARKRRQLIKTYFNKVALSSLKYISLNKSLYKLLCSFLFWTEGGKSTDSYVYFINSDQKMVATFLKLLRNSFKIDEKKLRALVHIHEYHNEKQILTYWSKITQIPLAQFSKSYRKPHTGKRIRENYRGSIRIRYYDYKIALELRSIYNTFVNKIGA